MNFNLGGNAAGTNAPAGGGFNFNPQPGVNKTPGTTFNVGGTGAGTGTGGFGTTGGFGGTGGFGTGYGAAKPPSPPRKLTLSLSTFNEPQAFNQLNKLQSYENQVVKNEQFRGTFYQPQVKQAATTQGFGNFGAKPAATATKTFNDQALNYDFSQLQAVQVQNFSELNQKIEMTQKDTDALIKKQAEANATLANAMSVQKNQMQEINQLIEVQNIIKMEFFKRFPLQNYNADVRITQMLEEIQQVGQQLSTIQPKPMPQQNIDKLRQEATNQETQVIELIKIGQQ
ncbi:Hypothetical_protein [Hexamita inflata]|uniref:Hypothetical_protein n=1 Tax=Hexamita inflata TaxID=28002 RepID=A0AA86PP38_9EUKA|nr:Hypothetical protein HINF_LOCUS29848 [Hexamita inflata]